MGIVRDSIADIARIDSIEATAVAASPQSNTYTKSETDSKIVELSPPTDISGKADVVHVHVEADIIDLDKYTKTEVDTSVGLKADKANPTFTGSITEQVYELVGTELNPTNGTIQYKTIATDTTFTESIADGQSVLLRLAGGDTNVVTWFTAVWVTGAAPTLTANDVLVFWKEGTTLYGSYVGSVVAV